MRLKHLLLPRKQFDRSMVKLRCCSSDLETLCATIKLQGGSYVRSMAGLTRYTAMLVANVRRTPREDPEEGNRYRGRHVDMSRSFKITPTLT